MARRWIDWPDEDIVLDISRDDDPIPSVVAREFLPDPCCFYCMKYKECEPEDDDYVCEKYEWDEDLENLRKYPKDPKREDFRTEKAYRLAVKAVREWWLWCSPDPPDDD